MESDSEANKGKRRAYWNFEYYAAEHGLSALGFVEPGLHRSSVSISQRTFQKAVRRHFEEGKELARKRGVIREEYERLIRSGDIREFTHLEHLAEAAKGLPERDDVQAARRLIVKKRLKALSKLRGILNIYRNRRENDISSIFHRKTN